MASSVLNVVNNIAERIHKIERKCGHDENKCETCEVKYKDASDFLKTQTLS